jgi:hypothetical protein
MTGWRFTSLGSFLFFDFTVPFRRIFSGNILMLITIAFYIAWWTAAFRPNHTYRPARAGFLSLLALLSGAAAITIKFSGVETLSRAEAESPVIYILLGAIVVYILLLAVIRIAFRRPVTAELFLIILWAALEGSALAVLQASDQMSMEQALALTVLVALAGGIGIVCYLLHYHLDEIPRFWNGLIPLMVAAVVVIVFLAVLAPSF